MLPLSLQLFFQIHDHVVLSVKRLHALLQLLVTVADLRMHFVAVVLLLQFQLSQVVLCSSTSVPAEGWTCR